MTWLRERAGLRSNIDYCYIQRPGGQAVFFVPEKDLNKVIEAAKYIYGTVDYEANRVIIVAYDLPAEASTPVIVPAVAPVRRR